MMRDKVQQERGFERFVGVDEGDNVGPFLCK